MDAKISSENLGGCHRICIVQSISLKKSVTKEMLTFVEKPSRPHHNWVIKVNISSNKYIDIMSPWGDSVVYLLSLPEVYNLIPIVKKSSGSPRLRDIVQNYWWVCFVSVKIQLLGTLLYKWVTVLVFFFRSLCLFGILKICHYQLLIEVDLNPWLWLEDFLLLPLILSAFASCILKLSCEIYSHL